MAVAALGGALFVVNEVNNPANVPTFAEQPAGAPAPPDAYAAADPYAAPDLAAAPVPPAAAPPPAPQPSAPQPPEPPAVDEQAYAGRSAGDEVTVAIAVEDGRAVGYVCDGDAIESWFEGTLEGDRLNLQGGDGSTLTGTTTEAAAHGTVTIDGEELPFSAAGAEGPAGLYEGNASVRGVVTRVGWIVTNDGAVTGVATRDGRRGPAPALDPATPTPPRSTACRCPCP
ncbi:hypothetical protein BJF78_30575 [Pseudonocardia sp. CNS-139]|nr:hypothetical protein BJF78_30575 [Pseudonocardia sp. CNS-139]